MKLLCIALCKGIQVARCSSCRFFSLLVPSDTSPELPIAICSREVREVLPKCEVSSSVPVSSPAVVMETVSAVQLVSNQQAPLCQRLKEVEAENEALMNAAAGSEEVQEPGARDKLWNYPSSLTVVCHE